jgi:hypothetical protein
MLCMEAVFHVVVDNNVGFLLVCHISTVNQDGV